jgi:hypothetical protein
MGLLQVVPTGRLCASSDNTVLVMMELDEKREEKPNLPKTRKIPRLDLSFLLCALVHCASHTRWDSPSSCVAVHRSHR